MNRFKEGLKAGIPIGIGYFAVAFSMGILAASAGLNPFQGFLASALITASAGENAALIAIREAVPYVQIAMITVVANIDTFDDDLLDAYSCDLRIVSIILKPKELAVFEESNKK